MDERFGSQGGYLVDFYHACDYLGAATAATHPEADAAKAWFNQQKDALKTGQRADVLESLRGHLEVRDVLDSQAPVRVCYRYLNRRQHRLSQGIGECLADWFGRD